MRKVVPLVVVAAVAVGGITYYSLRGDRAGAPSTPSAQGGPGRPGGGGGPGGAFRPPMTVGVTKASRASLSEYVTVVGNLIGAATVQVVPKVNGRLDSIAVRLSDPVRKGQVIAKVDDREVAQQVKQAEASYAVAGATVRQREADLKFAQVNLERSQSLFERQLMAKQGLDDADARYQAAAAQVDLAGAQYSQAKARLDELRITLANTEIRSPVDGFVGKRFLDPGAYASQNAPVVSLVDIGYVRLVANLVEKDIKLVTPGVRATVEVDAYPGESFSGHVSRVAPVFDPATRTAEMEIEVPNPGFRLKPGMYARVRLQVAERTNALTLPKDAVVDRDGQRGVFLPEKGVAHFVPVRTGLEDDLRIEILEGVDETATVIATGAAALRDGDKFVLAAEGTTAPAGRPAGARRSGPGGGGPGRGPGQNAPQGAPPAPSTAQGR